MGIRTCIIPDTYRDSVFLMRLSREAREACGAAQVSAMMGTPRNKELLVASGLSTPEAKAAGPGDLVIAVEGPENKLDRALEAVRKLLNRSETANQGPQGDTERAATLAQALKCRPDLNLALISVAGDYARLEAAHALAAGLDVMLYSDNISLADEIALKCAARAKNLLLMGPDCSTAIIRGVPLGFANRVRKGPVGLVGASGTGLQELSCLLDRCGVGISAAYGTGGRDLKDEVGGITALTALERLAEDPETGFLALIGKPPGKKVRTLLAEKAETIGKPVFVHYLGAVDYDVERAAGLVTAGDLTELAILIAGAVRPDYDAAALFPAEPVPVNRLPGCLRGLFGGGALCREAAELAAPYLCGEKYANIKTPGYRPITGADPSRGHTFWDLGDDEFTVGRPHPMMAPELRLERLVRELCDPEVSVVLLDVVLGYGSSPDQAEVVVKAMKTAAKRSQGASLSKLVAVSVCGTEADVPDRESQVQLLEAAGAVVLPSNARAAVWAARSADAGLPCEHDGGHHA